MSVRLRLSRYGRKNAPFYRIGAYDNRTRRNGRPIEFLGTYNPRSKDDANKTKLDAERVKHWLEKGATPTQTVSDILKAEKVI